MRATSSELAIWRQRIGNREHRSFGSIECEVFGALEAERWHALDYEARVREMAADRREKDPRWRARQRRMRLRAALDKWLERQRA